MPDELGVFGAPRGGAVRVQRTGGSAARVSVHLSRTESFAFLILISNFFFPRFFEPTDTRARGFNSDKIHAEL